jgi:putative membrane protein insertion efficiency factor
MTNSAKTEAPRGGDPAAPGRWAQVELGVVRAYQRLAVNRRPSCRYWPSCSEYAAQAIARHGARRGTIMAARRLARCHPWGGYGPDPVPD